MVILQEIDSIELLFKSLILIFPVELSMQNDKPFFSKNGKGVITFIAAYKVTDYNGINNMGVALQVNGEQVGYASIYKHAEAEDHL